MAFLSAAARSEDTPSSQRGVPTSSAGAPAALPGEDSDAAEALLGTGAVLRAEPRGAGGASNPADVEAGGRPAPAGALREEASAFPEVSVSPDAAGVGRVRVHAVGSREAGARLGVLHEVVPHATEVTVCTSVDAGPRRDAEDRPGVHRLLAEMLTLGGYPIGQGSSERESRAEFLASRRVTSELEVERDLVTFCTTGPSAELPLLLWVTAGRFTRLSLTEGERRAALERLAAAEEARDKDVILGKAPARLRQMVLLGSPADARPTLPSSTALETVDLALLRRLHEQTFVIKRSAIAVSGGFEPDVLERLLDQQLAQLPVGTAAQPLPAAELWQSTPRFSMHEDPSLKSPSAWYGWLYPDGPERESLELGLELLLGPRHLGRTMVGPGKAARDVTISADTARGPGVLAFRVSGTGPQSLGTIEKFLEEERRKMALAAPSRDEVEEAWQARRLAERQRLQTAKGRARALSEGTLRGIAWRRVLEPLDAEGARAPEPESIRLALAKYLVPERQSTIEIYPKGWQDPWQTPMPAYHIVSAGETLTSIAKQHRTSIEKLLEMNRIKAKAVIYPGDKLKVPRGKQHEEVKQKAHEVRRGDTLIGLGKKYGVSARAIAEANGMNVKQPISIGETLRIPAPESGTSDGKPGATDGKSPDGKPSESKPANGKALDGKPAPDGKTSGSKPAEGKASDSKVDAKSVKSEAPGVLAAGGASSSAVAPSGKVHVVTSGETLGGIALHYGVRLAALATHNGLSPQALVRSGQTLKIPEGAEARRPGVVVLQEYKVQNGDTLSGVAKKHGVTVTELERHNGISRKATLRVGQSLKIPDQK